MVMTLAAPELVKGTRNTSLEKRFYIMPRRGALEPFPVFEALVELVVDVRLLALVHRGGF